MWGDSLVANDVRRTYWSAQPAVVIRRRQCPAAEGRHEQVVLASEDVVVEAHANGPVVRKGGRFLAGPLRVDGIGWFEQGQVAQLLACRGAIAHRDQQELRWVMRIPLDATARGFVIAIDLGGIPPRCDRVLAGLVGPA